MKRGALLLVHGFLAFAGWAIGRAWSPVPRPQVVSEPPAKTDRPDQSKHISPAAEALLSKARSAVERNRVEEARAEQDETGEEQRKMSELRQRVQAMPPSADPAAAFQTALVKLPENKEEREKDTASQLEASAIFVHWALRDPEAALAFNLWEAGLRYCDDQALELAGEGIPADKLLSFIKKTHSYDRLLAGCVRPLIHSLDTRGMLKVIATVPEELRDSFRFHLRMEWPRDKRRDFDALAVALDSEEMFASFSDDWSRDEKASWLIEATARLDDSDFGKRMKMSGEYWDAILAATNLPMEKRLAALPEQGTDKSGRHVSWIRSAIQERKAEEGLDDFLKGESGPDYLYAFGQGRIEVAELQDLLKARFPGGEKTAAPAPHELYQILVVEDPVRAAVLLEGISEPQRAVIMANAIDYRFNGVPLDRKAAALATIPALEDDELAAARAKIWDLLRDDGVETYGKDYLDWAASLPDPRHQEMLKEAIISRFNNSYISKGIEIRQAIGEETRLPLRP